MTDFYAVLRDALARIGPGDTEQRRRVYGQVRTLMARRLANRQPPLSHNELARRTDELDTAIDRIEAEMMLDDELVTEPPPLPEPEGDEDLWGGSTREAPTPPAPAPPAENEAPETIWGTPAIDLAWDQTTEQWLDPSEMAGRVRPSAPRAGGRVNGRPAPEQAPPPRIASPRPTASAARPGAEAPRDDRAAGGLRRPADAPRIEPRIGSPQPRPDTQPPLREARQRSEVRWPRIDPGAPPAGNGSRPAAPRPAPDLSAIDAAFVAAEAAPPVDSYGRTEPRMAASPARRNEPPVLFIEDRRGAAAEVQTRRGREASAPQRRPAEIAPGPAFASEPAEDFAVEEALERPARAAQPRRSIGRKLAIGLGVIAALVLAWCLYVFVPILFPGSADPGAPAATGEARVPAEAGAPIVIFGGQNPAVFVGTPDNPVGFEAGENGGFARVASSTAGGARATIGRSVAQQLGGHTIRIAIDARGTPGRESITARLGYQRGDGLLEWQTINLGAVFYVWTVDWTIPGGASTGDFLIIEPGIPGDGTALDIRGLTIQILE